MNAVPGGTVTFVFTDIEGSTQLLQQLGDDYGEVVSTHRRLIRARFGEAGGTEIDTQGDAFFFSFPRARDAVTAAVEAQRALRDQQWPGGVQVRVRMGLHTGEPSVGDEGYIGLDVVRAARISAAGHGGQILLSETTRALIGNNLPAGVAIHDLGEAHLKDIQHEHVYELALDGDSATYPPLKTAPVPETEDWGDRLARRIQQQVERDIEASFTGGKAPAKLAIGGAAVGFAVLIMFVLTIVVIVLLIKLVL
jgi:class 3 adenylate cyclase